MSLKDGTGPEGNAAAKALGVPTADERRKEAAKKQVDQIVLDSKAFKNEDERQAALRFQEQCHLMLKWKQFTSQNPGRQSGIYYNNFLTIDHDTPFDFINKLFHKGADSDILFNLNASQLSLLVPQVRIFKIFIDPVTKEEFPIELPFDDSLSRREVANITKTSSGRGRGAGLTSFTWKTVGDMPANSFQFEANMTLHLQSVEDIFAIRDIREVQFAASKKTVPLSFADLLVPQAQFKKGANDGPRVWDPTYFKIKAVVGWKVLAPRGTTSFIPTKAREALERTQNVFILAMFQHEMDIRDDGSVDLSINFMTMPEMVASDPLKSNILFPSAETKLEIERLVETANQLEFELLTNQDVGNLRDEDNEQSLASGVTQSLAPGAPGALDPNTANAKKAALADVQTKLALFDNSKKSQSYRRILSSLFVQDKLFFTLANKDFFNRQINLRNSNEAGTQDIGLENAERTAERNSAEAGGTGTGGENPTLPVAIAAKEGDPNNDLANFKEGLDKLSEFDVDEPNQDSYKIIYFYFGDLLDVVLDGMFKKSLSKPDTFENKDVKVILGPLTFYDYGNLIDHGVVGKAAGLRHDLAETDRIYTGTLSSVNIADIPISMKVFTRWFNNNIANEGIETYTFHDFITKALNDLVIEAVKSQCYDFAPRQTQAKLTYKTFSVPENPKRTELFRETTRITAEDLKDTPFITEEHRALSDTKKMENYILLHASVDHPWALSGDYEEDRQNGIFHMFFGNERGIVKNIKFKREDKPLVRAANIANNYNESQGSTKVLREAYNANVAMVGNNLFEVGSLVRIIPSLGGSGDSTRLLKIVDDLGIGGYFMVLGREDRVEAGLYQTDLDLKWMSPANKETAGKIALGDKALPPNAVVSKIPKTEEQAKTQTKAEEVKAVQNAQKDTSVNQASAKLGQAERRNRGGGRRF